MSKLIKVARVVVAVCLLFTSDTSAGEHTLLQNLKGLSVSLSVSHPPVQRSNNV